MFEYLMPPLVMRAPAGSLLEQTDRLIVRRQIEYGDEPGLPWGISESAYNARDLEFTYQYSNFGVPGLGLKRGLGENSVVAPYATASGDDGRSRRAARELEATCAMGARGRYGFYEAVDFTPTRVQEDETFALVRAYMAHHQGMTIVAIANALFDGAMRDAISRRTDHSGDGIAVAGARRRARCRRRGPGRRRVKSARRVAGDEDPSGGAQAHLPAPILRRDFAALQQPLRRDVDRSRLRIQPLGRCRDHAMARRCDARRLRFLYFPQRHAQRRRLVGGLSAHGRRARRIRVPFNEDRAEITRRDGALTTSLEVLVSAEDDAEVRRVSITNAGAARARSRSRPTPNSRWGPRAPTSLIPPLRSCSSKPSISSISAPSSPRAEATPAEPEIWAAHVSVADGEAIGKPEFETDRARFLGRGHGVGAPIAMLDARPLTNSIGAVLDPIFSLRRRVTVPPGATVRVAFWTMAAESRAALLDCSTSIGTPRPIERATTLAWTQGQVQLHHLGVTPGEAILFQRLAGHVIFSGRALRPSSDIIRQGSGPQSGLWSQGISGDLPFVLLRIADIDNLNFVAQISESA